MELAKLSLSMVSQSGRGVRQALWMSADHWQPIFQVSVLFAEPRMWLSDVQCFSQILWLMPLNWWNWCLKASWGWQVLIHPYELRLQFWTDAYIYIHWFSLESELMLTRGARINWCWQGLSMRWPQQGYAAVLCWCSLFCCHVEGSFCLC